MEFQVFNSQQGVCKIPSSYIGERDGCIPSFCSLPSALPPNPLLPWPAPSATALDPPSPFIFSDVWGMHYGSGRLGHSPQFETKLHDMFLQADLWLLWGLKGFGGGALVCQEGPRFPPWHQMVSKYRSDPLRREPESRSLLISGLSNMDTWVAESLRDSGACRAFKGNFTDSS